MSAKAAGSSRSLRRLLPEQTGSTAYARYELAYARLAEQDARDSERLDRLARAQGFGEDGE